MEEDVLSPSNLFQFFSGQLEARNSVAGYLYHGEIREIGFEGETLLVIRFNWYAQMETNGEWRVFNEKVSEIDMRIYTARFIEYRRIILTSFEDPEVITLFPPRHTLSEIAQQGMLDPSKVRGLVLA
jgi:hypothetical protein